VLGGSVCHGCRPRLGPVLGGSVCHGSAASADQSGIPNTNRKTSKLHLLIISSNLAGAVRAPARHDAIVAGPRLACAVAMIAPTLVGAKNSAGETVPAFIRAKASMAS